MQQLIDQMLNHPVHAAIENMLSVLPNIHKRRAYQDDRATEIIQRAEYVLKFLQVKLSSVDPLLVSSQLLHAIKGQIDAIQTLIDNFVNQANLSHLHSIENHVQSLLQHLAGLTTPQNTQELSVLREAIIGFKRSLGQHVSNAGKQVELLSVQTDQTLQEIQSRVSEFKLILDSFRNDLTRDRERLESDLTDSEQTLGDKLKKIDQEILEKVADWEGNLARITKQMEVLLASQEELFASALETSATTMKETTDTGLKAFQDQVTNLMETEQNKLQTLWEYLETKKKEVEELAGSVSISSMAGFYKGIADREKKSENLWKWVSSIAFIFLIGYTCYNAYVMADDFTWSKFAPKIPVSIAFASFLAFCLRQLTVHRKHERYNRQTQLELSALEPYITTLDPDISKEIKSKLAEKLFGRAEQMIGISSADDKPEIVSQELILKVLDKVGTIVKAK